MVSTSNAAWYIPTCLPRVGPGASAPMLNRAMSWWFSLPLARRKTPRSVGGEVGWKSRAPWYHSSDFRASRTYRTTWFRRVMVGIGDPPPSWWAVWWATLHERGTTRYERMVTRSSYQ